MIIQGRWAKKLFCEQVFQNYSYFLLSKHDLYRQVEDVLAKDNEFQQEFLLFLNKQGDLGGILLGQQKDEKPILPLCELQEVILVVRIIY